MARATRLARSAASSLLSRDGGLLQVLRAEISHELSAQSSTPSAVVDRYPGAFTVEWDNPGTRDVVLRRRWASSSEEVAVSALVGPVTYHEEDLLPGNVFMKVCVKKGVLDRILQFDCEVWGDEESSQFAVRRISCLSLEAHSKIDPDSRRLLRSNLEDVLQSPIKEYLNSRGINHELMSYLLSHLRAKEQDQYVNWLRKLEKTLSEGS